MTLKVNFGALDTAAGDIKNGANNIGTTLSELEGNLVPLQADWDGDAKESYRVAQQQWNTALTDMKTLLEQVGLAVGGSNTDYQNTEQRARAAWT